MAYIVYQVKISCIYLNPPDIFSSIFFPECTELSANRVFISFCTIVQYLRVYFGQVSTE